MCCWAATSRSNWPTRRRAPRFARWTSPPRRRGRSNGTPPPNCWASCECCRSAETPLQALRRGGETAPSPAPDTLEGFAEELYRAAVDRRPIAPLTERAPDLALTDAYA